MVLYEYDSLINAALNLSILMPQNTLISNSKIVNLMKYNPYQFLTCKNTIRDKMSKIYY